MVSKVKNVKKPEKVSYELSSGNVFKDFGFQQPEEADAKSDLALLICAIIRQRGLTQHKAAALMEIDQPKVSKIVRGLLSEFTIDRLMKYLVALGCDIEIKPKLNMKIIPSIHVASPTNRIRLRA